jgi:glycine/D-amino acid oxidase-like deaminating enzyme
MEVEYIVVGCGLAGIHFCEQLVRHNKSFIVYNNNSQKSSSVAGGLYNPVVLKRFTPIWKGLEQLEMAVLAYRNLEEKLKVKLDYKIPVFRRFTSIEEQNNWLIATDNPLLTPFLSEDLVRNNNPNIKADFGFGEVKQTGRIDTKLLLNAYVDILESEGCYRRETFIHNKLKHFQHHVEYDNIKSKNIVFAEGFGLSLNPFYKDLPMEAAKGELITIYAPELKMNFILKSKIFIFPLGKDIYRVGATYNWDDMSNTVTPSAKSELMDKLRKVISCDFDVIDQVAGIRPTVRDRRPLVGRHFKYSNMYVLNGLGTRGVLISPYVAEQLFLFIDQDIELEKEISIQRFI